MDFGWGKAGTLPTLTDFRGDHDVVATAPAAQPPADDLFGFTAVTAIGPLRVGVGGVDEVPADSGVRVEDRERGCRVRTRSRIGPAKSTERYHVSLVNVSTSGLD